jgi:hypothetical protein
VPSRDVRTGPSRGRAPADRRSAPRGASVQASARRSRNRTTGPTGSAGSPGAALVAGDDLVLGPVPAPARAAGALLVLSGLAGLVAPFPTYLVVGGTELSLAGGAGSALAALLLPVVTLVVGAVLLRGAVPKFGLAYATVGAALGVGSLLIELYRGSGATSRPAIEALAGRLLLTTTVDRGAGWVLSVVSLGLLVVAGAVAVLAWDRTVMDDAGRLDPARSLLTTAAVGLGLAAVLSLVLPPADVPDRIVTDPVTGLETVVTQEGPQALLERPLLGLLGGLLLAGAVLLCSVLATSLRPRLAVVGGLLAIATAVLAVALTGLRDALASDELDWTVAGAGLLAAGLGYAVLALLAWRLRRRPRART